MPYSSSSRQLSLPRIQPLALLCSRTKAIGTGKQPREKPGSAALYPLPEPGSRSREGAKLRHRIDRVRVGKSRNPGLLIFDTHGGKASSFAFHSCSDATNSYQGGFIP